MSRALLSIARFTLLEGRRSRLPWIALGLIGCAFVAAEFSAALAITDSSSFRIGVYAALVRTGLVVLLVLFVATCVVRELSDRMLDLTLARPVPRASWYLGRLSGFCAIALVLALFAAVPLLAMVEYARVLAWAVALAAELALLGAVCLTATVTLRQVVPAVLVSGAFYVLARAIDAIVLMSQGPTVVPDAWSTQVISELLALIALLMPPLDRIAATSWLLGSSALPPAGALAAEVLIFSVLVVAVGLFDLYRVDD
ncbi:MAG: hypothetical protein WD928_08140 [Gammaproteobacteria bacterium]